MDSYFNATKIRFLMIFKDISRLCVGGVEWDGFTSKIIGVILVAPAVFGQWGSRVNERFHRNVCD